MRMGYDIPVMTFSIAGTGASFVTPSADMNDLRPAEATRVQWLSTGSPSITDTVTITGTFNSAINAGCAALLMPNLSTALPAGVKVTVSGLLSSTPVSLNGNSLALRTYVLPSGANAVHWVFPSVLITAIVVTIYNDLNGSTWATSATQFLIGNILAAKCADFPIVNDMGSDASGGLLERRSHNNQAWPLLIQSWDSFTPNFVPMDEQHLLGPLSYQDDFQTVAYAFNNSSASIVIPQYLNNYSGSPNAQAAPIITTGTINQTRLARYFMLGVPSKAIGWKRDGDRFAIGSFTMSQIPP